MKLPQPKAERVVMQMVRNLQRENGGNPVYYADLQKKATTEVERSAVAQVRDDSLKSQGDEIKK